MTRLDRSINGLRSRTPEMSADRTLSRPQVAVIVVVAVVAGIGLIERPLAVVLGVLILATTLYVLTMVYRLLLVREALRHPSLVSIPDSEARAIPDPDLPPYTVLVPLFREVDVIADVIRAMEALDYPPDRLDVKLLLEADDAPTIKAAHRIRTHLPVEVTIVPVSQPRTKPKACNYGLAGARGELVTIYDAEDRPEPLQLRRAVAAFQRLPESVACLQARLSYHNVEQNLLTRWFTIEYATWFSLILPAVARRGGPVPLGGTSMHIKRSVLDGIGAWDAFNVTEDADLGVRLARMGYGTAVLESTTQEEANSDFINWVKQRSRWYKGYLQTWLVHMRHPLRLWRELGAAGFSAFTLLVGAVPLLALINPFFWLLTWLWFLARPAFLASWLPPAIYYPSLVCMIVGNFLALYLGLIAVRVERQPHLIPAALVIPAYWLMMSVAAIRAFLQLVVAPSFWEKSVHGLDRPYVPPPQREGRVGVR